MAGCSVLQRPQRATEQINPQVDASTLSAIVVIAGDDARYDIRMATLVRQQLSDAGITALRRTGRWGSQTEALLDICPTGQVSSADGVVFVYYNQLTLWECRSRSKAIEIFGGTESGLPGMTKRLVEYLTSRGARSPASAPADSGR